MEVDVAEGPPRQQLKLEQNIYKVEGIDIGKAKK